MLVVMVVFSRLVYFSFLSVSLSLSLLVFPACSTYVPPPHPSPQPPPSQKKNQPEIVLFVQEVQITNGNFMHFAVLTLPPGQRSCDPPWINIRLKKKKQQPLFSFFLSLLKGGERDRE